MIRGVNKNIIEISDTENAYFERAILFVRPDHDMKSSEHIRKQATGFLSGMKIRPGFYTKGRLLLRIVGWFGSAAAGAALTAAALLL